MKGPKQRHKPRGEPAEKPAKSVRPQEWLPPLKPRPWLFYILLGAFIVWLGVLVMLYFTTKVADPSTIYRWVPAGRSR